MHSRKADHLLITDGSDKPGTFKRYQPHAKSQTNKMGVRSISCLCSQPLSAMWRGVFDNARMFISAKSVVLAGVLASVTAQQKQSRNARLKM